MWHLHFSDVDSTNSVGKYLLANGLDGPIAITADRQTAGRGSHDRTWYSEDRGGFYYSLAVTPLDPNSVSDLTVRVAQSCQKVIAELWGIVLEIEWPNDLILNGKKVGGILVEIVTGGKSGRGHGIIGIGLNINQRQFPELLRPVAISLIQTDGVERSLTQLKPMMTKELLEWL